MVLLYDVYVVHQEKMQGKKPIYWIYTHKVLQGIQTKPCNEFKLLGKESKQEYHNNTIDVIKDNKHVITAMKSNIYIACSF